MVLYCIIHYNPLSPQEVVVLKKALLRAQRIKFYQKRASESRVEPLPFLPKTLSFPAVVEGE